MTYLSAFATSSCIVTHTVLYHGQTLLNGLKRNVEADDIHAKLMRNYPEVPGLWYLTLFFISFALAVVAVEVWDTGIPVWSLLLSIALSVIYLLPSGFVYAMTGLVVGRSACLKIDCTDGYNDSDVRFHSILSRRLYQGCFYLVIRLQIWHSRCIQCSRLRRHCRFCRTSSWGTTSRFRRVRRFWVSVCDCVLGLLHSTRCG